MVEMAEKQRMHVAMDAAHTGCVCVCLCTMYLYVVCLMYYRITVITTMFNAFTAKTSLKRRMNERIETIDCIWTEESYTSRITCSSCS